MRKLVLGLTGGIASGKSEVLSFFASRGWPVVSSDALAHEALQPATPTFKKIVAHFGPAILSGGQIDRKKLGQVVFSSASERMWLEGVVHPYVIRKLKSFRRSRGSLVVLDIPLLFEAKLENLVDQIIVVSTSRKEQLKRLMSKRGLSRSEGLARLRAQWPMSRKIARADWVLDNRGTLKDLRAKTIALEKKLLTIIAPGV